MVNLLLQLLNPAILGILSVFLSIVWMLKNEKDKTRPLLVVALVLNLFYGYLLTVILGREDGLLPWKYDFVLFHMDKSLGISSTAVARLLQGFWRIPLLVMYQLMVPMMIVWFLVANSERRRKSLVIAYISELVIGPILYAILPACGPRYAFAQHWLQPPDVESSLRRLSGMPNAFPSLHVATAFVLVLFAQGRVWRTASLIFLVSTVMATIATGEHYWIDLIPGSVFGCFAVSVGQRRLQPAAVYLLVVLAWSLAIRFGHMFLIAFPVVLEMGALLTLVLSTWTLIHQWRCTMDRPIATP